MIKKILIGGAVTLAGAFLGALVEQMAHEWDSMADDYNDLLRKDQKLMDFVDNHDFYEKQSEPDIFESPNKNWKDYKPSVSMMQSHRATESNVDISMQSEKINSGKDTITVKTDNISGFKIVSVEPKKQKNDDLRHSLS